ncbi:MAG: hypothetical protein METHAR1v1_1490005 [Methanothrix sp.]|nr:MAG: hypothetical protein METHAR1v1_1490005 [Methanothrix sp.]
MAPTGRKTAACWPGAPRSPSVGPDRPPEISGAGRRGRGLPTIWRRGNAVRERAWRIGVGAQAPSPSRSDEVQGFEIAKKRTLSSLCGIAIQHCAERTRLRRRLGRGEGRPEAPTLPPEVIFLIYL